MQNATSSQLYGERFYKSRLNETTLVVPLLMPGIREIDLKPVQRVIVKTIIQYKSSIALHYPQVLYSSFFDIAQNSPYSRWVHIDTDVITLRMLAGHFYQRITHTKANFKNQLGMTAKYALPIN